MKANYDANYANYANYDSKAAISQKRILLIVRSIIQNTLNLSLSIKHSQAKHKLNKSKTSKTTSTMNEASHDKATSHDSFVIDMDRLLAQSGQNRNEQASKASKADKASKASKADKESKQAVARCPCKKKKSSVLYLSQ